MFYLWLLNLCNHKQLWKTFFKMMKCYYIWQQTHNGILTSHSFMVYAKAPYWSHKLRSKIWQIYAQHESIICIKISQRNLGSKLSVFSQEQHLSKPHFCTTWPMYEMFLWSQCLFQNSFCQWMFKTDSLQIYLVNKSPKLGMCFLQ